MDIRNFPSIYINLNRRIDRRNWMEHHLSLVGFKNVTRFPAFETKDGASGLLLSVLRSLHVLYTGCSADYVILMEDDIEIRNIDNINATFNQCVKTYPFEIFTITEPDREECYIEFPPTHRHYQAHFMIFKRTAIMQSMQRFLYVWLATNTTDAWNTYDNNTVVFSSHDCVQMKTTFDTDLSLFKNMDTKIYIYIHKDGEINGSINEIIRTHCNTDCDSTALVTTGQHLGKDVYHVYFIKNGCIYRLLEKDMSYKLRDMDINEPIYDIIKNIRSSASTINPFKYYYYNDDEWTEIIV